MNANPWIDGFDADAHAAFADAGMASVGMFTAAAGGTAFERRAFVNTGRQTLGSFGEITATRTVIGFFLVDGDLTTDDEFAVGDSTYVLQAIDETDEDDGSLQWWVVRHG